MKKIFLLFLSAVFASYALAQTTFYVSSSGGDDSNDGMSEASPFKSLAKASELTLKPGDSVLLKSGDIWKESFFPKGSGTPENPITISSYGEGPRPHIAPTIKNVYGIRLVNVAGYKIANLEISDCYGGIVNWTEKTYEQKYLWIENCYFHDITGKDSQFGSWDSIVNFPDLLYGTGICISGSVEEKEQNILSDITIINCEFDKCDAGIQVIARAYDPEGAYKKFDNTKVSQNAFKNLQIIDCNVRRSYRSGGVMLCCIKGGFAKNVLVDETGYQDVGMFWGVAGFQCARMSDFLVEDCTFSNTIKGNSPDGQGFDFESDCQNITVRNCKFIDNDGPAILWFGGTWEGSNRNNVVEGCYFEGNNRRRVYGEGIFMVWHDDNTGIIRDSEIRLSNDFQTVHSYPIVLDDSNKVYSPDGRLIFGKESPYTGKTIFEDDFSGDLSKWSGAETAEATGGRLAPTNGTVLTADTGRAKDYFIETEISFDSPDTEAGLIFRKRSESNYWKLKLVRKNGFDSFATLIQSDSKGEKEIGKFRCTGLNFGDSASIRVEAVEDSVKIFVDGNLMMQKRKGPDSAGGIGIWKGEGGKAFFDNFKIGKSRLLPEDKIEVSPNYAKGATATALSQRGDNKAENITDQNPLTHYSSEGSSEDRAEFICIDMPNPRKINTLVVYPYKDYFPTDFSIEVSMDGETWTKVASETNFPRPEKSMLKFKFPDIDAKYVMFNATKLPFENSHWTDNKNLYLFCIRDIAITRE